MELIWLEFRTGEEGNLVVEGFLLRGKREEKIVEL